MPGHNRKPQRLEKISAVCPSCIVNGDNRKQEMVYWGDMEHKGKSIPLYRCENCHSCRTIPTILDLNPGLIYNKK